MRLLRRGPGYCPRCHERVTPYAAGCAFCGADLDPRRWHPPAPLHKRVAVWLRGGSR